MAKFVWQLLVATVILVLGEARPGRLPWKKDPYDYRDYRRKPAESKIFNNNFQDDAFYYPDQEFFDKDSQITSSDDNNGGDDFSGWQENSDDEEMSNLIPTMPRDPKYDEYNFDNKPMFEFGPDDVIHDVDMFPRHINNNRKYHILEEEHFGNEINDIDKFDELRKRMEEMQREMRRMQDMLAMEYHTRHRIHRGRK